MPTIYEDGTYLCNNPTWHVEDSPWKAVYTIEMLQKHRINPETICEIGCGAGGLLEYLSQNYDNSITYSGYEISEQAFEICNKKRRKNLHFYLNDMLLINIKHFDLVLCMDVFEHIEDYFGFLRKLKGRGTYTMFHIPLDLTIRNLMHRKLFLKGRYSVGHLHYFTKDTALATLKDTGYEVIDYFYTDHHRRADLGWKATLIKLIKHALYGINPDATVRTLGGYSLMVLAR